MGTREPGVCRIGRGGALGPGGPYPPPVEGSMWRQTYQLATVR